MELALLLPLAALALIDSTSFATLAIPVWFMATPKRVKPGRILLFLGSVATFYFALGVALFLGAQSLRDQFASLSDSSAARWIALIAGVVLLILGLTVEPWTKEGKERKRARKQARGPGRLARRREAIADGSAGPGAVIGLAVLAAGVEAASMLPYLAAIGLLTAAELSAGGGIATLAGYGLLMITPALVLLALRIGLNDRVLPMLRTVDDWLSRNAGETLAWVFALVGLWLITNNWDVLRGTLLPAS